MLFSHSNTCFRRQKPFLINSQVPLKKSMNHCHIIILQKSIEHPLCFYKYYIFDYQLSANCRRGKYVLHQNKKITASSLFFRIGNCNGSLGAPYNSIYSRIKRQTIHHSIGTLYVQVTLSLSVRCVVYKPSLFIDCF